MPSWLPPSSLPELLPAAAQKIYALVVANGLGVDELLLDARARGVGVANGLGQEGKRQVRVSGASLSTLKVSSPLIALVRRPAPPFPRGFTFLRCSLRTRSRSSFASLATASAARSAAAQFRASSSTSRACSSRIASSSSCSSRRGGSQGGGGRGGERGGERGRERGVRWGRGGKGGGVMGTMEVRTGP